MKWLHFLLVSLVLTTQASGQSINSLYPYFGVASTYVSDEFRSGVETFESPCRFLSQDFTSLYVTYQRDQIYLVDLTATVLKLDSGRINTFFYSEELSTSTAQPLIEAQEDIRNYGQDFNFDVGWGYQVSWDQFQVSGDRGPISKHQMIFVCSLDGQKSYIILNYSEDSLMFLNQYSASASDMKLAYSGTDYPLPQPYNQTIPEGGQGKPYQFIYGVTENIELIVPRSLEPPPGPPLVTANGTPVSNASVHSATDGSLVIFSCNIDGGFPQDKNMTMECTDIDSNNTMGSNSSISFTPNPSDDGKSCACFAKHRSGTYDDRTTFTLKVLYGPTSVTSETIKPFDWCSGPTRHISVYGEINKAEINPSANMTLQFPGSSLPDVQPDTTDSTSFTGVIRYIFNFPTSSSGVLPAKFVAVNTQDPVLSAETSFNIIIQVQPPSPPSVTANNGASISNNGMHLDTIGNEVSFSCSVNGGFPEFQNVTMECTGVSSNTTYGVTSSISFTAIETMDNATCTCSAQHASQCYNDQIVFTLKVAYGPTAVTSETIEPFDWCSGPTRQISVYGQINKADINPSAEMTLKFPGSSLPDVQPDTIDSTSVTRVIRYSFNFNTSNSGVLSAKFVAVNTQDPVLSAETSFNVSIQVPPPSPPSVTANNGASISNNSMHLDTIGNEISFSCTVNGGFPEIQNVTMECTGVSSNTTYGVTSSITFTVMEIMDDATCTCSAKHASQCYNDQIVFTLKVAYGPTAVTSETIEPFDWCSGPTRQISVYGEINKADINPSAEMTLKFPGSSLPDVQPDTIDSTSVTRVIRYSFNFNTSNSGVLSAKFVAVNTQDPVLSAETSFNVSIQVPPPDPPTITVENGDTISNSEYWVQEGKDYTFVCNVHGGFPEFSTITMDCEGVSRSTTNGITSSISFTAVKTMDKAACACHAQHASQCYDVRTTFTLNVAYGPPTVTRGPLEHVAWCSGPETSVSLYCDVNKLEVSPSADLKIQFPGSSIPDADPTSIDSSLSDVIRYHFTFPLSTPGSTPARCVATNSLMPELNSDTSFDVIVDEPPANPPELSVNGQVSENGKTWNISLNQDLLVVCQVKGGTPHVSGVTLTCGSLRNDTDTTEASTAIAVVKATDQMTCQCSATHVSGCYDDTTSFKIQVWYPTVLQSFHVGSSSTTLDVTKGTELEFVCKAEGLPLPSLSIRGKLSGKSVLGQETATNSYSKTLRYTMTAACEDTDTYVCTSDNGIPQTKSVTLNVKCPPLQFFEDSRQADQRATFPIKSGGVFQVFFLIRNYPNSGNPNRLFRVLRRLTQRLRRGTTDEKELNSERFKTSYEQVDLRYGRLQLDVFDPDIQDTNDYRLQVSDETGEPLQIYFNTTLDAGDDDDQNPSTSPHGSSSMIAVGVAGLALTVLFLMLFGVTLYYCRAKRKHVSRTPARRSDARRSPWVVAYNPGQTPRGWRLRRF